MIADEDVSQTEKEVSKEHDITKEESNQISTNVDEEQQMILEKQLKYTKEEIQAMKPNLAAVVVANKIKCPKNGMPLHFYKDDHAPPKEKSTTFRNNHIRRWISSILLTSIILFFVNHTHSHNNGNMSDNAKIILNTLPESSAPSINNENQLPNTNIPSKLSPSTKSIPPQINNPGQKKRDRYRSDLDATWLDHGITKTLRFLDKIFNK